jgi:uncharacterized protein HemX
MAKTNETKTEEVVEKEVTAAEKFAMLTEEQQEALLPSIDKVSKEKPKEKKEVDVKKTLKKGGLIIGGILGALGIGAVGYHAGKKKSACSGSTNDAAGASTSSDES